MLLSAFECPIRVSPRAAAALLIDASFPVDHLLDRDRADFQGGTPLYASCTAGHAATTKLLLERRADPTRHVRGKSYVEVRQL